MATLHKTIKPGNYPYAGSDDQLRNPSGYWQNCRVTFHDRFDEEGKHDLFYFSPKNNNINSVVAVIDAVEEKIGVPKKQRLSISPNEKLGSYQIELTDWWRDPIRLTFLTCLMRDCRGDKFDNLFGGRYLQYTKVATERFLAGNVFYHGSTYKGWQTEFSDSFKATELLKDKPADRKTVDVCHFTGWQTRRLYLSKI